MFGISVVLNAQEKRMCYLLGKKERKSRIAPLKTKKKRNGSKIVEFVMRTCFLSFLCCTCLINRLLISADLNYPAVSGFRWPKLELKPWDGWQASYLRTEMVSESRQDQVGGWCLGEDAIECMVGSIEASRPAGLQHLTVTGRDFNGLGCAGHQTQLEEGGISWHKHKNKLWVI